MEWREDAIPYSAGCHICGPCGEPGYVRVDAISTAFCACCIRILVTAAPDVARAALATEPQAKESTR